MKYLIEHLDPKLFPWSLIEYKHLSKMVGKNNLIFTNVREKHERSKLSSFGKVYAERLSELIKTELKGKRICLMDAGAGKKLSPADTFDVLVFGGILGDNPPQNRTMKELGSLGLQTRNLGDKQMPTDNAVLAAYRITGGTPFQKLDFVDEIEIEIDKGESIILPFRYMVEQGKICVSDDLITYIKKNGFT
ncbi:MAG TPA: SAM-dependent methyltransferase [Candidatus Nanoarchaeia archaeon]|nr:SAM-dependent methyltransferase [Candidatus Nanoarchaeia archaeon]